MISFSPKSRHPFAGKPRVLCIGQATWVFMMCAIMTTLSCTRAKTGILLNIKSAELVRRIAVESRAYSVVDILAGKAKTNLRVELLELPDGLPPETSISILLEPEKPFEVGVKFLLYVTGIVDGETVTGNSVLVAFAKGEIRELTITLTPSFVACDVDLDGVPRCGLGCSDSGETCDCNDRVAEVNPYYPEVCDGRDNNCEGFLDSGIECDDRCVTDLPCGYTDIPNIEEKLGVGVCVSPYRKCVDGKLEACPSRPDDYNEEETGDLLRDGLDNDCNGTVDFGGPCTVGTTRACLLGQTYPRSQLYVGLCRTGVQTCSPITATWGDCVGAKPPALDPLGILGPGEPVREPSGILREGENDCDGLDNDCDGIVDNEPYFDKDSDGFNWCGSCTEKIIEAATEFNGWGNYCTGEDVSQGDDPKYAPGSGVNLRDGTSLWSRFIDCDDSNSAIKPPALEDRYEVCGVVGADGVVVENDIDENCLCDHGANVGNPTLSVGRVSACGENAHYLDCSSLGARFQDGTAGTCGDADENGPRYYYGFDDDAVDSDLAHCFRCGDRYGRTCEAEGTCSTKAGDCAGGCSGPGEIDSSRPICQTRDMSTCQGNIAGLWESVADGEDPKNDCAPVSCTGYYVFDTVGPPVCRRAAEVPGSCNGTNACKTDAQECIIAGEIVVREACTIPSGCTGSTPPTFTNIVKGQDPYEECPDKGGVQLGCQGLGGGVCEKGPGDSCGNSNECGGALSCIDGVCCSPPSIGDADCPGCQSCAVPGSLGTCTALPGIVSEDGSCTGQCTQCVNGTCTDFAEATEGECGSCSECSAGGGACRARVNGPHTLCTDECCNGSCVAIGATCGGAGGATATDCAPGQMECRFRSGAWVFVCDTAGAVCTRDTCDTLERVIAGTCDDNGDCTGSGTQTECTTCQACSSGVCSDLDGRQDLTGSNSCTTPSSCVAGACLLDNGEPCGTDRSLCASGFCVDGVCCNNACTGICRSCNSAQTTADVGVCGSYDASCGSGSCADSWTCSTGDTVSCGSPGSCNSCSGSMFTPGTCDTADGTCSAGSSAACVGGYTCASAITCRSSCSADTECQTGYYCDGSSCQLKQLNGVSCTRAGQCSTNNCSFEGPTSTTGVCCNLAPSNTCQSCLAIHRNSSGTDGTRGAVSLNSGPRGGCASYVCSGAGACASSCSTSASCREDSYCTGTNCIARLSLGDTCSTDRDCASSLYCELTAGCTARLVPADVCARTAQCHSTLYCNLDATPDPECSNRINDGTTACVGDGDCVDGRWCNSSFVCQSDKSVGATCTRDAECGTNLWCSKGNIRQCVQAKDNGQGCSRNAQCIIGTCSNGTCS